MNRRTVLQSAGVAGAVSLSGCLDVFRDHFGAGELRRPVPVEIFSEAGGPMNVALRAVEEETNRESYDHSYTVVPDEQVSAPPLGGTAQLLRVILFADLSTTDPEIETIEDVSITSDSRLITIVIYEDDLEVNVEELEAVNGDEEPEPESTGDADDDAEIDLELDDELEPA